MAAVDIDTNGVSPVSNPQESEDSRSPSRHMRLIALASVMVPVGACSIVLAYHHAAGLPEPDDLQFLLFWFGFLGGMLPLVALACSVGVSATLRTCALVGIGLFGMVPRLQRFGPAGSDEFIHLRQSMEALFGGDVGHTLFLLPITKEFFGMHQVTAAFARVAGLPLWFGAMFVITLAHVLSVLAIYQLIRLVDAPARGAAVGAVVYTLNPSWLFFNAGFSYESLALPLVIWCLAAAVGASRPTEHPNIRAVAAGVFCAFALPMIHHLSTILLCLILILLLIARLCFWYPRTIVHGIRKYQERIWPMAVIWFSLLISMHFWWSEKYDWLLSYLSPAWTEGFSQLGKIFKGFSGSSSGQRSLFGGSQAPVYEIVSAYLYPFVVLAMYLISLAVLWRIRRHLGSAVWGFAILAAMFFASMPMLLTHGGAEGAHRSWGYSFIGIAVICGLGWSYAARSGDVPRHRRRRWFANPMIWLFGVIVDAIRKPKVGALIGCVLFAVLSFGGATLGVNLSARFPGTANVGDDARSVSKEGAAVAQWMSEHADVDTTVMGDRYVSLQLGSLGRMSALRPSARFPIWDLYMEAEPVRPEVLKMISDSKIRYFVVDSRMATVRPRMGYWFTRNEPGVRGDDPFPQSAIDRFDCLPWLHAAYGAGPLTVYEVDGDVLRHTAAGSCEQVGQ